MVGSTNVSKISLSAGLAGPGCPMLVAHCSAVLIGLSFEGGVEPNGSFAVACSSHLFPDAGFWATGVAGGPAGAGGGGEVVRLLSGTAGRGLAKQTGGERVVPHRRRAHLPVAHVSLTL